MKKTSVVLNCVECGKPFEVKKYREQKAKFCSFNCAGVWKAKHWIGKNSPRWFGGDKTIICKQCGEEFFDSFARIEVRKYCSKKCQNEARRTIQPRKCLHCGKEFIPADRKDSKQFCSRNCYTNHSVGNNSPRWEGGKSFEPYPVTFNKTFKKIIRERDNHICAVCGKAGKDVHHINYVKNDTTPENCITLCRSCHCKTNSNRKYWINFFSNLP